MTGLTNFAFILTWAHGLAAQETLSVALAASHCTATHPLSDEVALVGVCLWWTSGQNISIGVLDFGPGCPHKCCCDFPFFLSSPFCNS
jgi:hypothetical protein